MTSPVAEAVSGERQVRSAELFRSTETAAAPPGAPATAAVPPAAPDSERSTAADAPAQAAPATPSLDVDDAAPNFWDRAFAYRPSLPLLLGLVLVTICVAYIYRPQETPAKRRGSPETTERTRLVDEQNDEPRPQAMSAQSNPRLENRVDTARQTGDELRMPQLDMPANASSRTNTADAGLSLPAQTSTGDSLSATGGDPGSAADGSPRTRLATRPAPTEHFESTPPPRMPETPQVQPDSSAAVDDEDGPPPDISGRNYPQTNPLNFYYRPTTPETREANRSTPTLGGTR